MSPVEVMAAAVTLPVVVTVAVVTFAVVLTAVVATAVVPATVAVTKEHPLKTKTASRSVPTANLTS
jgi:hypothetical protein